ncbi:MAG TPA: helix-turn-helix domain-containing protein [Methylobacter sp.]|jgi:transcriptional regulator with XRE-family HTH domain
MATKLFKELLANAKQRDSYWVEKAKLQFSIELNRFFIHSGMSQKALAEKMGTSTAYITKVFRGDANFTIETMVKLTRAIDGELKIHIAPAQSKTHWFDVLQSPPHIIKVNNEWLKPNRRPNDRVSTAA